MIDDAVVEIPVEVVRGAFVRLSGWIGPTSIKWTGRVEVSSKVLVSLFNTEYGVMVGPDYPPQPPFPGVVCAWQNVKSAFELPMNAVLPSGPQVVSGRSWSGKSTIRKVDVSLDGGKTWRPARLREPNVEKAWVRWDVDWTAVPDNYTFRARATDNLGQNSENTLAQYWDLPISVRNNHGRKFSSTPR